LKVIHIITIPEEKKLCEEIFLTYFQELQKKNPSFSIPKIIVSSYKPIDHSLWEDSSLERGLHRHSKKCNVEARGTLRNIRNYGYCQKWRLRPKY
jgi:hypothetical protein